MINLINKIKNIRKLTKARIVECKNALIKFNGNMELAIIYIRQNNSSFFCGKIHKLTNAGIVYIRNNYKKAILFQIKCKTDFAAQSKYMNKITKVIGNYLYNIEKLNCGYYQELKNVPLNITDCQNIQKLLQQAIYTLKEHINIKNISIINDYFIGSYLHYNKQAGAIVAIQLSRLYYNILTLEQLIELANNLAMHIVGMSPQFIKKQDISSDFIRNHRNIFYKQKIFL